MGTTDGQIMDIINNDSLLFTTQTNLVLQVNRSHLHRMEDFLKTYYTVTSISADDVVGEDGKDNATTTTAAASTQEGNKETTTPIVEILTTKKSTISNSCSLLFIRTADDGGKAFVQHMMDNYKFVLHGLNKMYIMTNERSIMRGDFKPIKESDVLSGKMNANAHDDDDGGGVCVGSVSQRVLKLLQTLRVVGTSKGHKDATTTTTSSSTQQTCVVVKVEVFPSTLQHRVISNLTALLDGLSIPESTLDISPVNHTHTLSILQMDNPGQRKVGGIDNNNNNNNKASSSQSSSSSEDEKSNTYFIGIAPVEWTVTPICRHTTPNDICRAFNKLKEAFERYRRGNNHTPVGREGNYDDIFFPKASSSSSTSSAASSTTSKRKRPGQPILAVDCGASPGGWTKYLLSDCVDEVYAIDPGEMDPSLLGLGNVHHLRMTAAKAIPELRDALLCRDDGDNGDDSAGDNNDDGDGGNGGGDSKIALWVSDMCVHDIPAQVDAFLHAHSRNIFRPNAAFVLTIKCNVGHGKERFDKLAEEEGRRLKEAGAYGMQIVHLFSNRRGERTIIGFIK